MPGFSFGGIEMELPDLSIMIIRGAVQQLGALYKLPPEQVNFYSSTNRLQLAMRMRELLTGENQSIKWPQMFVHSNTVTLGEQGTNTAYSPKQLARHGLYLQINDNQTAVGNMKLTPAVFGLEVVFMSDDFFKAFSFATSWVLNSIKNAFNFSLTYAGNNIDIRVEADPAVNTPDRDEAVNHPNVYEYSTNLTIWGYIGDASISTVPVLNQLAVGTIPSMPPSSAQQTITRGVAI